MIILGGVQITRQLDFNESTTDEYSFTDRSGLVTIKGKVKDREEQVLLHLNKPGFISDASPFLSFGRATRYSGNRNTASKLCYTANRGGGYQY